MDYFGQRSTISKIITVYSNSEVLSPKNWIKRMIIMSDNPIKNSNSVSRTLYLDIVRVFAVVCITLNHAVNRTYDNYSNQYKQYLESSFVSTFIKTFITVFSHIGVPLFLMITGVLILNKNFENPQNIKKFIKNNYLNLFITTEIWIFIMFWFIKNFFADIIPNKIYNCNNFRDFFRFFHI